MLTLRHPDNRFNMDMHIMDRWLASVYAVARMERPASWTQAWDTALQLVGRGEAVALNEWATAAGVECLDAEVGRPSPNDPENVHHRIMRLVEAGHAQCATKKDEG